MVSDSLALLIVICCESKTKAGQRPKSGRGMDGRTDGHMEIHPCVLQDIGPLGPLPCFSFTFTANHDKQGKGIADHMISLVD